MNEKLIKAVKKQIGDTEYLTDVTNNGANAGYPGFTYYSDTVKFFKQNRKEIVELVREMAEEFGESPLNFVAGFNCLKPKGEWEADIARASYGRLESDDYIVPNALSWFALEEVARIEENQKES